MSEEVLKRVQDDARRRLSWQEERASNLFVESKMLREGHVVQAAFQKVRLQRNTYMVFADDQPLANWGHPCRYLLYGAEDGELYKEVAANFPPYLIRAPETYQLYHEAVARPEVKLWYAKPELPRLVWRRRVGDRYAVLFSGASNNRHVNDMEFLYRTLIDVYNFQADHIYVLNYDGSLDYDGWPHPVGNWPGDSTPYEMPVQGAGTQTEFEGVIDDLKGRLRREDLLLIHTNNHGSHDGSQSCLCAYDAAWPYWTPYYASDFAAKLGELPAFRCLVVMMEQCHSGGFNTPIINNSTATRTSVSSACVELNSSVGGTHFDPFARDWIAAMNGFDPDGSALAHNPDGDSNGCISAAEAHNYANAVKHPSDTPVYSENPAGGGSCHLGEIWSDLQRVLPKLYYEVVWKRIWPYYEKMPRKEFYRRFHEELVPPLEEVQMILDERTMEFGEELRPRIEEAIERAFG